MKAKIILEPGKHKNNDVIFLIFPKDAQLIAAIKTLNAACWSQTLGKWYILKSEFDLSKVFAALMGKAFIDYSELKEKTTINTNKTQKGNAQIDIAIPVEIEQGLSKLKLWMAHKRYSESTIATYLDAAKSFLKFILPKPINDITNDDVVRYVNEYIINRGLSFSYQTRLLMLLNYSLEKLYIVPLMLINLRDQDVNISYQMC